MGTLQRKREIEGLLKREDRHNYKRSLAVSRTLRERELLRDGFKPDRYVTSDGKGFYLSKGELTDLRARISCRVILNNKRR